MKYPSCFIKKQELVVIIMKNFLLMEENECQIKG